MSNRPYIIPLAYCDPIKVFKNFLLDQVSIFLDSATQSDGRGRFAYIVSDPFKIIRADDISDPFAQLEDHLKLNDFHKDHRLPPFQGGAVGFLGYELGRHMEKLPQPKKGLDIPDMIVGLFDTVAAFDTVKKKAWVIAHDITPNLRISKLATNRPPKAVRAQNMAARISVITPDLPIDWTSIGHWRADLSRSEYEDMVMRVKNYINNGDIFQANITQRLLADLPEKLSPFMLYKRLRTLSPAPFGAYLKFDTTSILSASPERFLSLDPGGNAITRPIKGNSSKGI